MSKYTAWSFETKLENIINNEISYEQFGKSYAELMLGQREYVENYIYDMYHPEWRQIIVKGEPTHYSVNKLGYIRDDDTGKTVYTALDPSGYQITAIKLSDGKTFHLLNHRAVAIAFIPNPDPEHKTTVNHIDGIKNHPYYRNLEWATPKENIDHSYRTGLHALGENNALSKYKEEDVRKICLLLEKGKRPIEIAKELDVDQRLVSNILNRGAWAHISKDYNIPDPTPRQFLPDDVIHEVCKRLVNGERYVDIANALGTEENGLTRQKVRFIATGSAYREISDQYDIPGLEKSYNQEPKTLSQKLFRMFDNGLDINTPTKTIAEQVGLDPTQNKYLANIMLIRRNYKRAHGMK